MRLHRIRIALSSSPERSVECSDGNIRLTISSGENTTGQESSDGSTTRVDSGNESRAGLGQFLKMSPEF